MPTFIGSEEHKRLFCQTFTDTHRPFDPSEIQWPDLDGESLERLRSLPIWDEAVETESETALKVQCLAKVEPDPVLAQAIALQGYEEGRHAAVLNLLTRRYGIAVKPFQSAGPPSDPLWAFLRAGYSECLESFFAFGLFAVGKRSGLFPDALIEIFDPILQEEARHILFIVNWAAYLRARAPLPTAVAFEVRRTWTVAGQIAAHLRQAVRVGGRPSDSQKGFTLTARSAFDDLSARSFLELCLSENDRRLAPYDARLLRPCLVPGSVRRVLKILPEKRASARVVGA